MRFIVGDHHRKICEALDKVVRGEIKRLIINIAPRYGKTELVSKNFIAYGLALNPRSKFIHLSYSDDLVLDNSKEINETVQSDYYQRLFPEVVVESKNAKKWYTSVGGGLYAVSAAGQVTGFGAGQVNDPYRERREMGDFIPAWESDFAGAIVIDDPIKPEDADLLPVDKWILSKVNTLAKDVTENMDKYELGIAVQKVYDFIWDEFCDWYVETAKYRIYHKEEEKAAADCVLWVLKTVLKQALKLLHPFMPFITEEIYSVLVPEEESLMMSEWPQFHAEWDFPAEENVMEHVKEITRGIRNMRAEMNVPNNRKTKVYVVCEDTEICDGISTLENSIKPLMMAEKILVQQTKENIADNAVSVVVPDAVVYLPLEDLVDFEQEMERLQKEEEKLKKEIKRAEGMLSNERFISKAPEAKVQEEREKLEKYTQMLQQVQERMAGLKK